MQELPTGLLHAVAEHARVFRLLRATVRREVLGLEVRLANSPEVGDAFERVQAALALIRDLDPRRFRRLSRDLRRIVVAPFAMACYHDLTESCILPLDEVQRFSEGRVATIIVHEATHARLHRARVRSIPALRQRIEQCCVREQVAFVGQLQRAGWGNTEAFIAALHRAVGVGS